jgi:PEP-CTERM motif
MNIKQAMTAVAVAAAAIASAPASAAADYSLLFQGVTFEVDVLDSDSLTLTMLNTDAATGDWTGITNLNAFQLKELGSFTAATATGPGAFVNVDSELNGSGCAGGSGGDLRLCFSGFTAVAPSLSWTIDVTGGSLAIGSSGPHLKVRFGNDSDDKVGSLLSLDIPAVPEPETYALMLAGLAAVGFVARRRKSA